MDRVFWQEIWERHSGKIVGTTFGMVVGILIITVGFFRALFVLLCMMGGYQLGKRIDDKEDILAILDRILPPGNR